MSDFFSIFSLISQGSHMKFGDSTLILVEKIQSILTHISCPAFFIRSVSLSSASLGTA